MSGILHTMDPVADEIFRLTNEFRAEYGLAPFDRDACLDGTAKKKSEEMIATQTFAHGDLNPAPKECKYSGVGENIAMMSIGDPATAAKEFVYDIWATSTQGHREAMLSTDYTTIGVDVESNGQGFHATQHFAARP